MKPDRDSGDRHPVELRTNIPHPARIYDYLLGGKDNFPADRAAVDEVLRVNPTGRTPPRENRAFLGRAVRYLAAEAGIRQFLDIGAGIPTPPNVHQIAQGITPESRVVYVDNDPIVMTHARALLISNPEGRTDYVDADLLDVESIVGSEQLKATLDLSQPVGLLLIAVLHFLPDDADPHGAVTRLVDALPSGSYVAVSHLTGDFNPVAWETVAGIYRRSGMLMRVRPRPEIARFFDGLEFVDPGLQSLPRWRPDPGSGEVSDAEVSVYGGVARKP
jgi:hypothetical protein